MRFRQGHRVLAWLLAMTAAAAAVASEAAAEPMVRVRAASRLSAFLRPAGKTLELRGRLADDLDQPLPGRRVTISLARAGNGRRQLPLTTDAEGRFATLLGALDEVQISASFAGDALHTGIDVPIGPIATAVNPTLEWSIEAGETFDLGTPRHEVEINAFPTDVAAGMPLSLRTDFGRLGNAVTDASGRARFSFAASRLGPPRRTELIVEAAPSGGGIALRESRTIIVRGPTVLTLDAASAGVSGEVQVSGSLRAGGLPLPERAIALEAEHTRLATLQTDADGYFEATLPVSAEAAPAGELLLRARFESDAPWRGGSRSEAIRIPMPPQRTPHAAWLLVPALLSVALLLRYRPRDNERDDAKAVAAAGATHPGFQPRNDRRASWAGDVRISGQLVDLEHGGSVPRASVQVVDGSGGTVDLKVDARGGFVSPELAPGDYTVVATAPDYCAERTRFEVPHRGQWAGIRVTLERIRNRAFEEYRAAGDALGPIAGAAAVLTPREILDSRRAGDRDPAALVELVARVERAVYGTAAPDGDDVAEIRRRSAALKTEIEAEASDGHGGGGKRATIPHQR